MMDDMVTSLIEVEEIESKAWYITKKNNWGDMLGSPIGLNFCQEWAKEFGWPQEE